MFIEIESRMAIARRLGAESEERLFNGYRVSVGKDAESSAIGVGDGCTAL